jgi:ABC-type antimicrobial peptide transport system permease subunit
MGEYDMRTINWIRCFILLTLVLATLQLTGVIAWSWWIILSPVIVSVVYILAIGILVAYVSSKLGD